MVVRHDQEIVLPPSSRVARICRRYFAELKANPQAWEPLLAATRHGRVTLVYSSHDTEHNNAVALKEFLEQHLGKQAA